MSDTAEQTVVVHPGRLRGSVSAPPSKSAAHRAAICAALADGESVIRGVALTQDMQATMDAAGALGAWCSFRDGVLIVKGVGAAEKRADIDCNESGSTLRFFVPIAAALGTSASFFGKGKLPQRPMSPLTEAMAGHGVAFSRPEGAIVSVSGKLQSGRYAISGSVSSQYITGLLFALPLLEGDSEIVLTSPLQSAGYVDMTLQMMRDFGVEAERTADGYRIPGGQRYRPCELAVEGDYSGAAFWLCAGALHSEIGVRGLRKDSLQGDREILSILERMGASISREMDATVHIRPGERMGQTVDVSDIPDLMPVLASLAAYCKGTTVFTNASRLRIKESDRLSAVAAGLSAIGAVVLEEPDKLTVVGKAELAGGVTVSSWGDHRIAMAMAIAALGCRKPVTITGAQCVQKSYPGFFDDLIELGGNCHVL